MARKLRLFIENVPVHIKLNSINSMNIFNTNDNIDFFLTLVEKLSLQNFLKIHSYGITKTYFEFLATPSKIVSIPKFMQNLGREYVTFYNKKYDRQGTLWSGRYKSSIIESNKYLFDVMCYIERNKENIYSSVKKNLYDNDDRIITYHDLYKNLSAIKENRIKEYSRIFNTFDESKIEFIEKCLEKQLITASSKYIENLEKNLGKVLTSKQRGRPRKIIDKRKKMYKNLQVLDKEKHKNLKISGIQNLDFLMETSFLPVVLNESAIVGKEFPLVFTSNKNPTLVALVALGGENLALNNKGKWINKYIPAYVRRYPFSIGSTKENKDQKIILIDEDSSLFSEEKGNQLFKKSGEQSKFLENAISYLKNNDKQTSISRAVVEEISKYDILEDREISLGEGEEKKILVNGFKVIDREKLNNLSDEILASWARRGILSFIDVHIKSLENINKLFTLLNNRQK